MRRTVLLDDDGIARLRLRRQHLTGPRLSTPEAVVGWLGAMQAQELGVAKWAIAQRCRGRITSADLDRALADGRILRTHALRATWHFVLPADLRWLLRLIGPRMRTRTLTYYRREGLSDVVFARSQAVLREALAGRRQLIREEMATAFVRGRVAIDGLKLRFLLLQAELDLVVCSGARRGKHQTFALVDDMVPPTAPLSEDDALAELTRRYFASHGPATFKDFLWWSSLTAAQARRGIERVEREELRRFDASGRTYYVGEAPVRRAPTGTSVHMLQAYDEYMIGYTESRDVLAIAGKLEAPRGASRFPNAVTRDGQVIGFWRTVVDGETMRVEVHLAGPLDAATRRALDDEVERYGRFLQRPVRLVVKPKPLTRKAPG